MTQIAVIGHKSGACRELQEWLFARGLRPWFSAPEHTCDVARNQMVTRFLRETTDEQSTHLWLIDGDMVPWGDGGVRMLASDEPLAYLGYMTSYAWGGHVDSEAAGASCIRGSREFWAATGPPWFTIPYNPERTMRTGCDCCGLHVRAKAAGFKAKMLGHVAHKQEMFIVPKDDSRLGYGLVWPHELVVQ